MSKQDLSFIQQQANDWLVKLETGGMADGDEERFVAWLEKDPVHGEVFYEAEQAWKLMHQVPKSALKDDTHITDKIQISDEIGPTNQWRNWLLPIAATFLLTFTSLFWWRDAYYSVTSDHYTSTGARQIHTLEDGSVLTLNTASAVSIDFTNEARVIEVLEGEIHIQVAADENRTLKVIAGDMRVTALGTAFIVRKTEDSGPSVVVTEHKVQVDAGELAATPLTLEAGQGARLLEKQRIFSTKQDINQDHAKAWMEGRYVFIDQTLEDVVAELSRYYNGKILIRSTNLKQRRLSGVLDLDEPYDSLVALSDTLPIEVNTLTPYLIVIN